MFCCCCLGRALAFPRSPHFFFSALFRADGPVPKADLTAAPIKNMAFDQQTICTTLFTAFPSVELPVLLPAFERHSRLRAYARSGRDTGIRHQRSSGNSKRLLGVFAKRRMERASARSLRLLCRRENGAELVQGERDEPCSDCIHNAHSHCLSLTCTPALFAQKETHWVRSAVFCIRESTSPHPNSGCNRRDLSLYAN